ncbi:MAG: hydroxyacid dehydrogenase [Clostridia bacterium]|nr:hydroxyacid dehydrogenase [Clostridia bacterium]
MKIVLLDAETLGEGLDLTVLARFGEVVTYNFTTPDEIKPRIADADVILINKIKITGDVLDAAAHLRLVCVFATGYDNVDVSACRAHGVAVCNVRGYSTAAVAQLTVLMALTLTEKLRAYTAFVKDGSYTRAGFPNRLSPVYHEIDGKTWGIVGAGAIGQAVGRIAAAFGCRVLYYTRTAKPELPCVSLDTLLSESDILSLHTPLNDGTRGLIGKAQLDRMKPSAILINVARGAVTVEKDVADAIKAGKLGGFATDVYSVEPFPGDHPLAELVDRENVLLTPHMAWGALEARVRCLEEIVKNIDAFLKNEPRNRVDL